MLKFEDFQAIYESTIADWIPKKVYELIDAFNQHETIYVDPWPELVKKQGKNDNMYGLKFYFNDLMFRVNWKEGTDTPSSVDIWSSEEKDLKGPYKTIKATFNLMIKGAKWLLNAIKSLSKNESPSLSNIRIVESFDGDFEKNENPNIFDAEPEETHDPVAPEEQSLENEDVTVFDELRELVILIIDDINSSLIITGRGGVGKSHTVEKTFQEFNLVKNEEYVITKGASTALSMYKELYINNGKIIVFDDCDSIFKDPDGLNILKAALDSYSEREISWLSRSTYDPKTEKPTEKKPVPNRFLFDGRVIFITNKTLDTLDSAVKTRSMTIEVELTSNQMIRLMEKNLPNILPSVDMIIKKEVFDYIKSDYRTKGAEPMNVRTLIKAIKIRMSNAPNWKTLVQKYA